MMHPTTALQQRITVAPGHQIDLVLPPAGTDPATIIEALVLPPPRLIILLLGGSIQLDKDQTAILTQLYSRGIARACASAGALILDGSTHSEGAKLIGQGVAERGHATPLIGVAPQGNVTYPGEPATGSKQDVAALDPNHTHFILTPGDTWGSELDILFALAAALAQPSTPADQLDGASAKAAQQGQPLPPRIPVVGVLVNGDHLSRQAALQVVRHGWPLVVFEGSGGLADEVAALTTKKRADVRDPALAEILADGHLLVFSVKRPPEELACLLEAPGRAVLLKQIWQRFATYDLNAGRHQITYRRLLGWTLWLGLLATFLVVLQKTLQLQHWFADPVLLDQGLHYAIVAVPVSLSVLLAVVSRFTVGEKYINLRASAEAIKAEIYQYRMCAGEYASSSQTSTPELLLSQRVAVIAQQVVESNVNSAALVPYQGDLPPKMYGAEEDDDGLSLLTPQRYLATRLKSQQTYYQKKTATLEKQFKLMQWGIYLLGGLGTLLAAVNLELFVAATTAMVAAATSYLESNQTENTLKKYNQAETRLAQVKTWWYALSPEEQKKQDTIDRLVNETEKTLQTENAGWVLSLQEAVKHARPAPTEQNADASTAPPG